VVDNPITSGRRKNMAGDRKGHALRIAIVIAALVLMAGGAGATKSINDNATGGDCTFIGTWNVASKTCTLTTDLTETIEIDSDGITLDGNGHMITGSNTGNGINLLGRNGVTIENTNVRNFSFGIYLYNSSNNTLSGNNANPNYGGTGIVLWGSSYNTMSSNNASNNYNSIVLRGSSYNTLSGNNASNNYYGIVLWDSSYNTIFGNNANSNKEDGIYLEDSSYNTLSGNNASNNYEGIVLYSSSNNNTLGGNNANSNNDYGIFLVSSSNISIYNNFFNNTRNFGLFGMSNNNWNTTKTSGSNVVGGFYLGGNFWAYPNGTGFSQTCADSDSDGICDSPYVLDANNTDYLPLAFKPASTPTLRGDVNRNGIRDTGDATLILRYVVDLPIPSEYNPILPTGDMNCNGIIDTGDATLVLRDVVGLDIPRCWE